MKVSYVVVLGALFFVKTDAMLFNHSGSNMSFTGFRNWSAMLGKSVAVAGQNKNTTDMSVFKAQVPKNSIEQLRNKQDSNAKTLKNLADISRQTWEDSENEVTDYVAFEKFIREVVEPYL